MIAQANLHFIDIALIICQVSCHVTRHCISVLCGPVGHVSAVITLLEKLHIDRLYGTKLIPILSQCRGQLIELSHVLDRFQIPILEHSGVEVSYSTGKSGVVGAELDPACLLIIPGL